MSQATIEKLQADWAEVELLADAKPFAVRLTSDIRILDGEVIFKRNEEFNVYPAILRHGEKMYEVADGYAKGFMLNVADCHPTFIN